MSVPARPAQSGRRAGGYFKTGYTRSNSAGVALAVLREQGHLADIDLHFAGLIARLDGGDGPELPLAAALASAWTRNGHACIALPGLAGRTWPGTDGVPLPALERWIATLRDSPVVAGPTDPKECPLILDERCRLYLQRLWTAEQAVATGLRRLAGVPAVEPAGLVAALRRFFPDTAPDDPACAAARTAATRRICVVSGGPGTGKTTIAAAIVALLVELELAAPNRIVLVAPTGKAAARLQEAVRGRHRELAAMAPVLEGYEVEATTVHRWLLRRGRSDQLDLPIDALILDEGSMVDLTLMAQVLAMLPDRARLVLLGDASQLASVQPGAVFADVCRAGAGAGVSESDDSERAERTPLPVSSPLVPCVVQLLRNWRFDATGGIGRLAAAVVRGDASGAVAALEDPADDAIELRPMPDARRFEQLATAFAQERFAPTLRANQELHEPGDGSGPLSPFRVLCAHRTGTFGAERFNRSVERRLRDMGLVRGDDAFYPGRPILVTRNDPRTGLSNGDTGIALRDASGRMQVWFPGLEDPNGVPRILAPARLPPHESFFAVTVHRAQGSEYDEVAVILGPPDSRVATRELLYTAITRARRRVILYGSANSITTAVERATERSSGLRDALDRRQTRDADASPGGT